MKIKMEYLNEIIKYLELQNHHKEINDITNLILKVRRENKNVFIFGNGGSASIADHIQLDLSNKCDVRSYTYNSPGLITCFSNDYGFKFAIRKFLEIYLKKGDIIFLISSSGTSENMILTAKYLLKTHKVITFTGFKNKNKLSKLGNINLWVDSNNYNVVETLHQMYFLQVVENIISKEK